MDVIASSVDMGIGEVTGFESVGELGRSDKAGSDSSSTLPSSATVVVVSSSDEIAVVA